MRRLYSIVRESLRHLRQRGSWFLYKLGAGLVLDAISIFIKSKIFQYNGLLRSFAFSPSESQELYTYQEVIIPFCCFMLIDGVFRSISSAVYSSAFSELNAEVQVDLLTALIKTNLSFFNQSSETSWAEKIHKSCDALQEISLTSFRLFKSCCEFTYLSYTLWYFDPPIKLIFTTLFLMFTKYKISEYRNRKINALKKIYLKANTNTREIFFESLHAHELILWKSSHSEEKNKFIKKYSHEKSAKDMLLKKRVQFDFIQSFIGEVFSFISLTIAFNVIKNHGGNNSVERFENVLMLLINIDRNLSNLFYEKSSFHEAAT